MLVKASIPIEHLDGLNILYLAVGADGQCLHMNAVMRRLLGVRKVVGSELDASQIAIDALLRFAAGLTFPRAHRASLVSVDGDELSLDWWFYPVHSTSGRVSFIQGIGLPARGEPRPEVSFVGRRDQALPDVQTLLLALDQVKEHVAIAGPDGTIQHVNAAFETLSGRTREELRGCPVSDAVDGLSLEPEPISGAATSQVTGSALSCGPDPVLRQRVSRKPSGELFLNEIMISSRCDDDGRVSNYIAVGRESVGRPLTDPVTGLGSRASLLDRLGHAIARSLRDPELRYALIFLDVDRFKQINDAYGHDTGDQVILEMAHRIAAVVRAADLVAHVDHLNRDEFAVLLEGYRVPVDAFRVAERILCRLEEPMVIRGHSVTLSVSAGLAFGGPEYTEAIEVMRDAETAMTRAKSHPVDRCHVFEPSLHQQVVRRLELANELRVALSRDQLVIHYQPVVELGSGRITGAEALVRWQHPERGMIPPGEFIAVAEENGLIVPLGRWVLREACRRMQSWHRDGNTHLSIAVNVSARQFRDPHFVEMVQKVLWETELEPQRLELEVTESTAADDPKGVITTLGQLRSLGIRILLDDFGTGYSSLSYLTRFPLNKLKIDRSFVMRTPSSQDDNAVAATIAAMAHSLKLGVVAEGVETEAQRQFMLSLGCEEAQGFLFSRPVSERSFTELIGQRHLTGRELE